ncbi:MAG: hypothetical protein ACLRWF_09180 [Ruthenibacterium sp.]
MPAVFGPPAPDGGDIDPNTDANVFKAARFMAGFNNWRCISICGEGITGGHHAPVKAAT